MVFCASVIRSLLIKNREKVGRRTDHYLISHTNLVFLYHSNTNILLSVGKIHHPLLSILFMIILKISNMV